MAYGNKKLFGRARRKVRVRKKIFGTGDRPRLTVFRSNKHLYAQIVDDEKGVTVASASTLIKGGAAEGDKKAQAKVVGQAVAATAVSKDVSSVVFDRNGYKFHGRVKAIADGAREGGLKF